MTSNSDIKAKSLSEAAGTILAKLCYRVADEIRSDVTERMSSWRRRNANVILEKASAKYAESARTGKEHAPPRLIHKVLNEGSWSDNETLQGMWAGLLVSSCSADGSDEGNLIFINILTQLTSLQVSVLSHACGHANVSVSSAGWIQAAYFELSLDKLIELTRVDDFHRLDRELDHLRALELINGGFHPHEKVADVTPKTLALQMYIRCQGYLGSPIEYFGLTIDCDQHSNNAPKPTQ